MKWPTAVVFAVLVATLQPARSEPCQRPDTGALIQQIDQHEQGLKALNLDRATYDRLRRQGRAQLIRNHDLMAQFDELCARRRAIQIEQALRAYDQWSLERRLDAIKDQNDEIRGTLDRRRRGQPF